MALNKCSEAFWDFGWLYTIEMRKYLTRTASNDRPPKEIITSLPVDVSEYVEFDFYSFVKYLEDTNYPEDNRNLGRWLGVAHRISSPMTYWIRKDNEQIIPRSPVQPLSHDEWNSDSEREARRLFDATIKVSMKNMILNCLRYLITTRCHNL